jgi:SWI/SNF-related matrix-associated actin-dependent regulator of chromatin subfamily B protein 1
VTVVPLSTSLAAIPPVEAEEVKKIQEWMEVDRKYENVYREMKTRMGAEHRELMGPAHIPWWEQGTLDMNASRFLHGREKFEVRYPYRKRDRDSSRRKAPKREGLKLCVSTSLISFVFSYINYAGHANSILRTPTDPKNWFRFVSSSM